MAFEPACGRAPAGPSSSVAVKRDATASLPERRPYVSLRGRSEFARVYRDGFRRRVGGVLVVAMSGGDGPPRVGVVAGRRVGGAVVRNRAKRRLREALARVELRDGATYVVVALPGVASATFEQVLAWVRSGTRPDRKWMEETD